MLLLLTWCVVANCCRRVLMFCVVVGLRGCCVFRVVGLVVCRCCVVFVLLVLFLIVGIVN